MAHELTIVNGKQYKVTIEKVEEQDKLKWVDAMMLTPHYLIEHNKILQQNTLAARILSQLALTLSRGSPFIEVSQSTLAKELATAESHLSSAIKFLIQYKPSIVYKVKNGVFMLNYEYIWKCSLQHRQNWLYFIEKECIDKAYEVHKAGKIMEYFKDNNLITKTR